MPDEVEGPPITRREIDIALRWAERDARRYRGEQVPQLDVDILLCLDLISVLRADLAVAVIRVTSWARLAREQQEAIATARGEGCSHATLR